MHLYGLRFFYERTRPRPWPAFDLVRPRPRHNLPVVWSRREGRSLLALVAHPTARMCLQPIDACGRRLRQGTPLQVAASEAQRLPVRVRQGTGGNDRFVPLAPRVLALWRADWQRQRPRPWLFPARHQQTPLPAPPLPKTCQRGVRQSGIPKAVSLQTLRHSYAPLSERGAGRGGSCRHGSATRAPGLPPAPPS
jgi:integrase/recombinase XerD